MEAPKFTEKIAPHDDVHIYFKSCYFHILKDRCFMGHVFGAALYYRLTRSKVTRHPHNWGVINEAIQCCRNATLIKYPAK